MAHQLECLDLEILQSQLGGFIDPPLIVIGAHDIYVETEDGRALMDLCSGYWLVSLGYGNSEIIGAMTDAANELSYGHLFRFVHRPAIELAEKLIALTGDVGFNKVLFANSGSEAMEITLHLAARYAQAKELAQPTVVHVKRSYHGSSFIEQSLTTFRHYPDTFPLARRFHAVSSPLDEEMAERSLEEFMQLIRSVDIAAFVCEPIQGVGGVIVPPDWYLPEVRRLCNEHDILLVFDEVSTGIAVTGNWFGFQTVGAVPDVMALGKRLGGGYFPISAVLVNEKLSTIFDKGFEHGHATSGHPVGCRVALKVLEIIERDDLIARVRELGQHLSNRLVQRIGPMFGDHSLSGVGLMQGIRTANSKTARLIQREAIDRGILFINEGKFIVLCLPFIMTVPQIEVAVDRLAAACESAARQRYDLV